jgi:hypothetical protein
MKPKKRTIYISIVILIIILALFYLTKTPREIYIVERNTLDYSENRPRPDYQISLRETTQNLEIYNINFKSRPFLDQETTIYGLLFLPKDKDNVPGIVFLPGGASQKKWPPTFHPASQISAMQP